ncbi:ribonuclease H-like domain-containing protein [Irpex rosettiformis]|uniref:Ribonuclease H-like domain-containing protein n=1 Tax=Irpex rosettiformis TaxID=378272 RepID=A0ACB8TLY8_9APHY|nr:ribonuclease H-like domain-containing protein [Irpex rosettiformis]
MLSYTISSSLQVVIVALEDNSADRKTGDNLLAMIYDKIQYTEHHFDVRIVSFVSDSGGESKKARRLLATKRPDLVVLPCYAHQTYLIVGDYFKCNADILAYASRAEQVISWLRSKTYVLAQLQIFQEHSNPGVLPKSVVRAVLTRWTSHFLAYRRLLFLRPYIMTMVQQDSNASESQIITGSSSAKAKAVEIISYLNDDKFWSAVKQMELHLEPFAYATNITQSDKAQLDSVLLVFALLYNRFEHFPTTTVSDKIVVETICNSINTRWEASDQDVFIAAVILNPTHKTRPFRKCRWFSLGLISVLMVRLYCRFFGNPTPPELLQEVAEYLQDKGLYRYMKTYQDLYAQTQDTVR